MRAFLPLLIIAMIGLVSSSVNNGIIEDYVIETKHPIFLNETFWSGYIPIEFRGSLFFWMFESRRDPNTDPVVIWLTGGPGCASEIALFFENGPFTIKNDNKTLKINPYSWNNIANVVFIDQPLGTGFSWSILHETTEDQIAEDFYVFLHGFAAKFPQFVGRDLYITGESYAGHYIPAIATRIAQSPTLNFNFKGVAIGNGLMSMYHQYPEYATFAYENKMITETQHQAYQAAFKICQSLLESGSNGALLECQLTFTTMIGRPPKFNVYDIREKCEHPPLCYDMTSVDKFLKQPQVREVLGVGNKPWTECDPIVHAFLSYDIATDLATDLGFVLDKGIQVLLYHGDKDFICNWRGGEALASKVPWKGNDEYNKVEYTEWDKSGAYKQYDNFVFYRVYDAGHMVPMNQPKAAIQMLERFIKGW